MYPSLIIAHNLCYSTIVLDKEHPFSRAYVGANGHIDDEMGVMRINGHTFVTPKHQ